MPQDGSNNYQYPPGTPGIPDQTIESEAYNTFLDDLVVNDLNIARPVHRGGTGANSATEALVNLSAEKANQIVTNYDSHIWSPGSFRSSNATGQGAPVDGHAFAGIVYINEPLVFPPTNLNVTVEARDQNDTGYVPGRTYVREKKAGTWSSWTGGVYAAPLDALAYNGMQINGSFDVDQPNVGVGVSIGAGTVVQHLMDNWYCAKTGSSAFSIQQQPVFTGYAKALKLTITTAQASIGSDVIDIKQSIEGYRTTRLAWGTASAIPMTIGFWVKSSVAGTLVLAALNSAQTTTASATVTIASANVAQFVTATFPAQTTGTWLTDNGAGVILFVRVAVAGGINIAATNGNTFEMTGIIVLPGIYAPTAAQSALIMRPYDQELVTCQRYFQKYRNNEAGKPTPFGGVIISNNAAQVIGAHTTPMRAAPTVSHSGLQITDVYVANFTVAAVSSIITDTQTVGLHCTVDVSTMTPGRYCRLQTTGSADHLTFDARL